MSISAPAKRASRFPKEIRRAQLIQTAIHLFAQKGFRGTTTKEIADAAGINEAIIFRHFASKEELYSAILDHEGSRIHVESWLPELRGCAERREDEAVFRGLAWKIQEHHGLKREFVKLMLYSALEGHRMARMFHDQRMVPLESFLEEYIARRQREGVFGEADAGVVARGFLAICNHEAMLRELFGREWAAGTVEQSVETFAKIFLNGLRRGDGARQ